MGVDINVQVGSFLKITPPTIGKRNQFLYSINERTGKEFYVQSTKFDPETGEPLKIITGKEGKPINSWDIEDITEEENSLLVPEHCCTTGGATGDATIVISNFKMSETKSFNPNHQTVRVDITAECIEKSKKEFQEKHGKEIEKLRERFDTVEIDYGVLTYSL